MNIIVSPQFSIKAIQKVEVKKRASDEVVVVPISALKELLEF